MERARHQTQEATPAHAPPEMSCVHNRLSRRANSSERYSGNQAALRRLSHTTPLVQRKLEIGAANDPLEAEADRVADQVMRMPDPAQSSADSPKVVRRKCTTCEEEDKKLHKKDHAQAGARGEAPLIVHDVLRTPGQPLDAATRGFFEPRFDRDFSQVQVHTDAVAAASARDVGALAYATGTHIVFGAGRYSPRTADGRSLLAHELAHVVQQGGDAAQAGLVSGALIQRSESVHPEEQYCEDLSKNPEAPCAAIIECITDLIEELAGRLDDLQNKGGDPGHWERFHIVQGILETLMTMAALTCKNGEYDPELQEEAKKWRDKGKPSVSPEAKPADKQTVQDPNKTPLDKLRELLPSVPNWVWTVVGVAVATVIAGLIIACFASGACELGAIIATIVAAVGEAAEFIIPFLIPALRLALSGR